MSLCKEQAQFFLTGTCDLKCEGCPYPNQSPQKQEELRRAEIKPEQWKNITDFLYTQGCRLFCVIGGEPASYLGVEHVIEGIVSHPDAFTLLSTSGIHLLHNQKLRRLVGDALAKPRQKGFKNGIAISFDNLPVVYAKNISNSRALKAEQGLDFITLMQEEYSDQIIYCANVMVSPGNLAQVLEIQTFLEQRGIFTNLCTQQGRCFGSSKSVFGPVHTIKLGEIAAEMISRKIKGKMVANSVSYLSQLAEIISSEQYHCWDEPNGNPVIDVGPEGVFYYCNWIGSKNNGVTLGISFQEIIGGRISLDNFHQKSRQVTQEFCPGCSWSRRDRSLIPMVGFNNKILEARNFPDFDPADPKLQNIWRQAQASLFDLPAGFTS